MCCRVSESLVSLISNDWRRTKHPAILKFLPLTRGYQQFCPCVCGLTRKENECISVCNVVTLHFSHRCGFYFWPILIYTTTLLCLSLQTHISKLHFNWWNKSFGSHKYPNQSRFLVSAVIKCIFSVGSAFLFEPWVPPSESRNCYCIFIFVRW